MAYEIKVKRVTNLEQYEALRKQGAFSEMTGPPTYKVWKARREAWAHWYARQMKCADLAGRH